MKTLRARLPRSRRTIMAPAFDLNDKSGRENGLTWNRLQGNILRDLRQLVDQAELHDSGHKFDTGPTHLPTRQECIGSRQQESC